MFLFVSPSVCLYVHVCMLRQRHSLTCLLWTSNFVLLACNHINKTKLEVLFCLFVMGVAR